MICLLFFFWFYPSWSYQPFFSPCCSFSGWSLLGNPHLFCCSCLSLRLCRLPSRLWGDLQSQAKSTELNALIASDQIGCSSPRPTTCSFLKESRPGKQRRWVEIRDSPGIKLGTIFQRCPRTFKRWRFCPLRYQGFVMGSLKIRRRFCMWSFRLSTKSCADSH